jgi:elongation factor G
MVPQPLLLLAIEPKTKADQDKLAEGLQRLSAEDPTLCVQANQQNRSVIIGAMGELHLEIILHRLRREFGVEAMVGKPEVAYKETLTCPADGEMKYAKHAGGRSHYAHVKIRLLPGQPGSGYVFVNEIVGGAIRDEYIKPIDDGVREALANGVLAGYPIDDVRVELYDGSYHDDDSSAMAFTIAGAAAFQDAARRAHPVLLEPIMRLEVVVPKEYLADVMANLLSRQGRIQSQEDRGGAHVIQVLVPLAEMLGYASDLRSRSQGRATYSMRLDRYEQRDHGADNDDVGSAVTAPHNSGPNINRSGVALPEPDDDALEI